MLQFKIEEAASWSDEEAAEILKWLEARPWRYDEVNQIREARGEGGAQMSDQRGGPTAEFNFDAKIDDVLGWVGDDASRAETALAAENAKGDDARVTLVQALEEIATS